MDFGFPQASVGGPPFAVIPSLGVGAPLAVLALLFPSLFGGVTLLFRRWTAFFTVFSVTSLAFLVHGWCASLVRGTWLSTTAAIWLLMTLTTLAGLLWAWRRHTTWLQEGPAAFEVPRRTELLVLGILSGTCLVIVFVYWLNLGPGVDPTWNYLLAISLGVWAGTLYKGYRAAFFKQAPARSELPTEGVMLGACLLGFVLLAAPGSGLAALAEGEPAAGTGEVRGAARLLRADGTPLTVKGGGMILSTPLVVGDRVYASVAHKAGLDTFGAVYCVDRKTRKILWAEDDGGGMKQLFSSPCVADGRLYVGEGFHDDKDCKLYCLDARTGKRAWEPFQTGSQTESSPCVAGGKVFFGAGNDGVYALDARTGKKLWQFPKAGGKLLRVGASPVVSGGRLYAGSGVDRNRPDDPGETAVFCLDADSHALKWKVPVSLPCWGAPAVAGDRVYFGLGNGDVFTEAKEPAGALLCLDARDGSPVWEVKVGGGVLERPVLDLESVYFGSRDGHCWCLDRATGRVRWKRPMGSPVIAAPAVAFDPSDGHATGVFVASTAGRVCCLDPADGKAHWTYADLEKTGTAFVGGAPRVVAEEAEGGVHRSVYFGACLDSLSTPVLYRLEDVAPR